ncbi:peptidyl-prolyl cis-trans isomerase [Thalassotalea sp. PLHSN55]|uniref:peptidylprolyl isomerase n=1 Tax=Thalassotalea sp. PLHSN55 TaxID=3435888 RepID=UPI003F83FD14
MLKKFLLEPLVHFLLLAILLFVAFDFLNPETSEENIISVSEGRVAQLKQNFTKVWRRSPTSEEINGMIDSYVLEEIYTRQALALGLDEGDSIIRRRLHQKMEFMLEDMSSLVNPSDEELKVYFDENSKNYLKEARYSFEQIYFSLNRDKNELDALIAAQEENIAQGKQPEGDNTLLPSSVEDSSASNIRRQFGEEFLAQLGKAKDGTWFGPVESGFGLHFIKISMSDAEAVKDFDRIKSIVIEDWQKDKHELVKKQYEKELLEQYQIDIAVSGTNPAQG